MGSADMFGELVPQDTDTIKSALGNAHGMLVRAQDLVAGSGDFSPRSGHEELVDPVPVQVHALKLESCMPDVYILPARALREINSVKGAPRSRSHLTAAVVSGSPKGIDRDQVAFGRRA